MSTAINANFERKDRIRAEAEAIERKNQIIIKQNKIWEGEQLYKKLENYYEESQPIPFRYFWQHELLSMYAKDCFFTTKKLKDLLAVFDVFNKLTARERTISFSSDWQYDQGKMLSCLQDLLLNHADAIRAIDLTKKDSAPFFQEIIKRVLIKPPLTLNVKGAFPAFLAELNTTLRGAGLSSCRPLWIFEDMHIDGEVLDYLKKIYESGVGRLSSFCNLTFENTEVQVAFLTWLTNKIVPSVASLTLKNCQLTDAHVEFIETWLGEPATSAAAHNNGLTGLDLSNNSFTVHSIERLEAILLNNQTLKNIGIGGFRREEKASQSKIYRICYRNTNISQKQQKILKNQVRQAIYSESILPQSVVEALHYSFSALWALDYYFCISKVERQELFSHFKKRLLPLFEKVRLSLPRYDKSEITSMVSRVEEWLLEVQTQQQSPCLAEQTDLFSLLERVKSSLEALDRCAKDSLAELDRHAKNSLAKLHCSQALEKVQTLAADPFDATKLPEAISAALDRYAEHQMSESSLPLTPIAEEIFNQFIKHVSTLEGIKGTTDIITHLQDYHKRDEDPKVRLSGLIGAIKFSQALAQMLEQYASLQRCNYPDCRAHYQRVKDIFNARSSEPFFKDYFVTLSMTYLQKMGEACESQSEPNLPIISDVAETLHNAPENRELHAKASEVIEVILRKVMARIESQQKNLCIPHNFENNFSDQFAKVLPYFAGSLVVNNFFRMFKKSVDDINAATIKNRWAGYVNSLIEKWLGTEQAEKFGGGLEDFCKHIKKARKERRLKFKSYTDIITDESKSLSFAAHHSFWEELTTELKFLNKIVSKIPTIISEEPEVESATTESAKASTPAPLAHKVAERLLSYSKEICNQVSYALMLPIPAHLPPLNVLSNLYSYLTQVLTAAQFDTASIQSTLVRIELIAAMLEAGIDNLVEDKRTQALFLGVVKQAKEEGATYQGQRQVQAFLKQGLPWLADQWLTNLYTRLSNLENSHLLCAHKNSVSATADKPADASAQQVVKEATAPPKEAEFFSQKLWGVWGGFKELMGLSEQEKKTPSAPPLEESEKACPPNPAKESHTATLSALAEVNNPSSESPDEDAASVTSAVGHNSEENVSQDFPVVPTHDPNPCGAVRGAELSDDGPTPAL